MTLGFHFIKWVIYTRILSHDSEFCITRIYLSVIDTYLHTLLNFYFCILKCVHCVIYKVILGFHKSRKKAVTIVHIRPLVLIEFHVYQRGLQLGRQSGKALISKSDWNQHYWKRERTWNMSGNAMYKRRLFIFVVIVSWKES